MADTDVLGTRLRQLRAERHLTQKEVAEPYSSAYISQIEAGKRAPSDEALEHFAARLGITYDELVTGVPASFEPETLLQLQEGWRALYLGRYDESRKIFLSCEKAARRYKRPALRAQAIVGLARCEERQGQTADALALFEEARQILEREAPLPASVEAVAGIARCHQMAGNARIASHVLETYLLELERQQLPDPPALMRICASLVWPYTELGLHERATEVAEKALRLQTRVEAPEDVAGMHLNVARALLNSGRPADAMESLRKAEGIYRDLNWKTEIARSQTNRGMVYLAEGNLEGARKQLNAALETHKEVGFVRGEARTLNELARLERLLGNLQRARELAHQAMELLSEMEAVAELALAHRELALALREENAEQSEKHFRIAIDIYGECGERMHVADTYRLLGDLLKANGSSDQCCDEYRAGLMAIAEGLDRKDS